MEIYPIKNLAFFLNYYYGVGKISSQGTNEYNSMSGVELGLTLIPNFY